MTDGDAAGPDAAEAPRTRREARAEASASSARSFDDVVGVEERPRKHRLVMGWKVLIGLLALVLVAGGAYAAVLAANWGSVKKVETQEILPDYEGRPEPAPATDGGQSMNVLLLGSDSRDPGSSLIDAVGNRSDTIMVANISGDRKTVTVMSIMRDSWVDIPG